MTYKSKLFIAAALLGTSLLASAADPIKIGVTGAFTGGSSPTGVSQRDGVKLGVAEINSKGGVLGRQIQLVERDDEAKNERSVQIAQELINKEKVIVYNTIQLYRHDRLHFLKISHQIAKQQGFMLGMKLVRGAYMEKERERAYDRGYKSPIQPDKASTDRDYDASVAYCIEHINEISVIVASHNEQSNLYAARLLDEKGLAHNHQHIHFSQLYGMSDNITFNLAKEGFNVSKYLPFGPIRDVIPYLMRRAQENSSVSGQTGRELSLIKKELLRRKG